MSPYLKKNHFWLPFGPSFDVKTVLQAIDESFRHDDKVLRAIGKSFRHDDKVLRAIGKSFRHDDKVLRAIGESFRHDYKVFRAIGESFRHDDKDLRAIGESFRQDDKTEETGTFKRLQWAEEKRRVREEHMIPKPMTKRKGKNEEAWRAMAGWTKRGSALGLPSSRLIILAGVENFAFELLIRERV
ncbi:hypothetical protein GQ457_12G010890 [Hibiscus cannabinus]